MRRLLGGLVLAAAMLSAGTTAAAADRIFWTVGPHVVAGNLDGSGQANFNIAGTTLNTGYGITIEPKRRWLVFLDNNNANSTLWYARLDGGGGGTLGDGDPGAGTFLSGPTGVTIDSVGDRAFVTNPTNSTLAFIPLDPSVAGNVFTSGGTKNGVYGITLDPSTQTLWWAAYGDNKIAYAHLSDHTGAELNTGSAATLDSPRGVAIDPATGTIYWANANANKISYAKLNGSGGNDLTLPGAAPISNPRGVAIDPLARRIYWVNDAGSIAWSALDGSAGGKLYDTAMGARFAVIQDSPRNTGAPAVAGGSDTGSVLSCSNGTWVPDSPEAFFFAAPTAFAYQWTLDGNEVAGATASSVTASAPGSYSCRVTASNEAGSAAQTSDAHAVAASPVTAPTPGGSNPPPVLPLTKPTLSALKESNAVFKVASASTPLTGKTSAKRKQGTVFSFRLDRAATVTIVIRRKKPGKPAKVATLKRTARSGLNKVKFTGRIRKRALKPGTHSASFTAKNAAGTSATRSLTFKIVRR